MDTLPTQGEQEVFTRVVRVITDMLKILREKDIEKRPLLSWETDIYKDLGIDSLEMLDLLNGLENEFQVNPNQQEAASKRTIREIVEYVIELIEYEKKQHDLMNRLSGEK